MGAAMTKFRILLLIAVLLSWVGLASAQNVTTFQTRVDRPDNGALLDSVTISGVTFSTIDTSAPGATQTPFLPFSPQDHMVNIEGAISWAKFDGAPRLSTSVNHTVTLLSQRLCIDDCTVGANVLYSWANAAARISSDQYPTTESSFTFTCSRTIPACNVGGLHSFIWQAALASNEGGTPGGFVTFFNRLFRVQAIRNR